MRKTIIQLGYTSDDPFIVHSLIGYSKRNLQVDIPKAISMIDIGNNMQITKPTNYSSSYDYNVFLVFEEPHMLFNIGTIHRGITIDMVNNIGHEKYFFFTDSMNVLILKELKQALNILKAKIN